MCVCVSPFESVFNVCIYVRIPKEPVGRWSPVGNVVEENLQLVVVVKVCNDDGAHRGRHGKLLGCYVLKTMTTRGQSFRHTEHRHGLFFFFLWRETHSVPELSLSHIILFWFYFLYGRIWFYQVTCEFKWYSFDMKIQMKILVLNCCYCNFHPDIWPQLGQ